MDCEHENTILEGGLSICQDCGECIDVVINFSKYECTMDKVSQTGQHRCRIRYEYDKSIHKDIAHLSIPLEIELSANEIFSNITDERAKRGKNRMSIIFGCVYHAYREKETVDFDTLLKTFNIQNKQALKGMRIVSLCLPEKHKKKSQTYVTPIECIVDIMNQCNATPTQCEKAKQIYWSVENRSSVLNRSRPKSVAAGVIFFYINHIGEDNKKISIKTFRKIVGLSELTITKTYDEIRKLSSFSN